jgi:3-phosphoshikimate 1-carboxyvinyltransferase
LRVQTARHFRGVFTVPGDKSISHRLAILGALADGETRIQNFGSAVDCASTLGCLQALGVSVRRDGGSVTVSGRGPEGLRAPAGDLDAGNSGSTLRMMAGVLAGRPFRSVLTGDASLRRRPVERVAAPLRAMGARLESTDGRPPLAIDGGPLRGLDHDLAVASAQVKTAILLAGLQAAGRTSVREPAPSRDHTERLLPRFGVAVERADRYAAVTGPARLRATDMRVPGDASSAAFLVVAALIVPESSVRIEDVLLNPARTAFLEVLRRMGGAVTWAVESEDPEPTGWIEARTSALQGVAVPESLVPSLIDEVPALAVAGACAQGEFSVSGASELRVKESDRIAALAEGLRRLGAAVDERPDGLSVRGGRPLLGTRVRAHEDHRIAMSLAVAGLVAGGETEVEGAECIGVSFPEFPALLEQGLKA